MPLSKEQEEALNNLKAMMDRQAGRSLAHQLVLARLVLPSCKDAIATGRVEKEFLRDVSAIDLGPTADSTALEIRRCAREEIIALMNVIRDALGHRRPPGSPQPDR